MNKEKPVADDTHQRKRLTFDPTINAGHVLTFIAMCICILTSWNLLDKRITVVEQAQAFQRERDQNQDNTSAGKYVEFKELLTKIDRTVEEVRREQLNSSRRSAP